MAKFSIDHLGIAVKSLAASRAFYEQMGLRVESEEVIAHEKVRVAMLPLGESRIELLEPTSDDSPIARVLARRTFSCSTTSSGITCMPSCW